MVRSPSHAGSFYPADAADLRRTVDEMLDWEEAPTVDVAPAIVVAPHAGYVYSGPVAAAAYRVLAAVSPRPRRFVLFGPSHFLRFRGLATPSEDVFATPLGRVAVDAELRDLVEANPAATRYDAAHHREHSLEVQLPFLQVVGGEVTMLPVLTGDIDSAEAAEVLDETLGSGEVFGVVSSDLSHYLDYETAAGRDRDTARAIVELRPQDLDGGDACGRTAIQAALHVARRRGWECRMLDLRSSGDTAGSMDRVVGYGAFVLGPRIDIAATAAGDG